MSDRDRYISQQTQRDKPSLTIGKPIVLKRESQAGKDLGRVDEIEPMLAEVNLTFLLVPLIEHLRIVYTATHNCKCDQPPAARC